MSLNDAHAPLKAGLYGCGTFGQFVLGSLAESPLVRVVALANRTVARGIDAANKFGIQRTYQSYEAMLADDELDIIILTTPPAAHGSATLAALDAGKHVLVEKPLATTLDVAERIINAAAFRRLIVSVDYPMLYTPLVEAVTLFRTSRLAGPLLRISVDNIASCHGLDDEHWFWSKELSGGIFVEHGVHFFDWCGRVAGEAQQLVAMTSTSGAREDRAFAAVKHANGVTASYYHAFVARPETERTRTVLSFESVDLILEGWIPTKLRLSGPSAAVATTAIRRMMRRTVASVPDATAGFIFDAGPKDVLYAEGVRASAEDLARSIREPGYVALNDVRRAFPSLRVAIAAREAARTGSVQDLALTKTAVLP